MRKNYGRTAEEIIAWINEESGITMEEIANNIGKSQSTIEKHIKKLREAGVIERIGSTKSGDWKIKL
jgi:ATP-dependent DNA helicase RecG